MAAGKGSSSKPAAGAVKTFSCPSCGGSIAIRAAGSSITAVCQSCGSLVDVANDNLQLIRRAAVKIQKSLIPLGARGVLFDVEWEVIGYSVLTDSSGSYDWREYLIFNPYQGFRFLVEADGHWSFVTMLRRNIATDAGANNISFDGSDYRVFLRDSAKVKYVMGEFYWRVKLGEKARVADYISPPYMLSMEKSNEDIVWSQGVYVEAKEIGDAFRLANMPPPRGIAPNQPSRYTGKTKSILALAAIFFVALWMTQGVVAARTTNQKLYEQQVHTLPSSKGQIAISDTIEIPGDIGNVEITSYSGVDNNWVELNVSLVDELTQRSYDLIQPIEYYHGRDSDGFWSEGNQTAITLLSAVPGGKYRLLVEPDAGAYQLYQPVDVTVRVTRDVPMWKNFWIASALLLVYPLYVAMRRWNFELRRWQNSDYATGIYNFRLEES